MGRAEGKANFKG